MINNDRKEFIKNNNRQYIIPWMFPILPASVSPFFSLSGRNIALFWRERRWKDFSEMLSLHHDESIATCRLHVKLSCRLHASSDNLRHFGGPEKKYYIHKDKKNRMKQLKMYLLFYLLK